MKNLPLHWKIIIGLALGIVYAFFSVKWGWNAFTIDWIDPFGKIFIRLLKFIAVPLVLLSIIAGISTLPDLSKLGRMGAKTLLAYLVTTIAAVGVGLLFVNVAKPGESIAEDQRIKNRMKYELWVQNTEGVEILDGKNFLSDPQYASFLTAAEAGLAKENAMMADEDGDMAKRMKNADAMKDAGPLQFFVDFVPENIFQALSNGKLMLQVIFFAIFFGIILLMIPKEKAKPVMDFVDGTNEVFLKMVEVVMNAAPFFVFALMAGVIAKMASTPEEVIEIFKGLAAYSLVLVAGLAFMVFIFYPLMLK
ncbi:MAG: cation:dicarboxylase symporter family transporter, partial [Bacteroidota bacterium]